MFDYRIIKFMEYSSELNTVSNTYTLKHMLEISVHVYVF